MADPSTFAGEPEDPFLTKPGDEGGGGELPPTPGPRTWRTDEARNVAADMAGWIDAMRSTVGDASPAGVDHSPAETVQLPSTIHDGEDGLGETSFGPPWESDGPFSTPRDGSTAPSRFQYQGCVPAGTVIDKYEVLGLIGWGGMGEVYRARHLLADFEQEVAIKIIRRSIWDAETQASDPSRLVARFYLEMRAAAKIRHDNVVPVLNAGLHDGFPYYVMLLVDGESLSKRLKRAGMTAEEAAALLEPIARAVDHAHANGVIHRDIKPSNIILDRDGKPYLTDFGLAKMFEQAITQTLTARDVLMGTPQYIPPEQVRHASRVGTRSDVYSLGATLYEMLTGRPPFTGDDSMAVVMRVLNEPLTPPHRLNREVPPELERICVCCLQKAPEDRYASAKELADELGRFLKGVPIERREPGYARQVARWARDRPAIAGLVLAVIASVLIGLVSTMVQLGRAREALRQLERRNATARLAVGQTAIDAKRALEAAAELNACPPEYRDWVWRFLDGLRHTPPVVLGGHPGTLYGVAFRPGGHEVVAAGESGAPWIWDSATGRREVTLPGVAPESIFYDVAWMRGPDGVERIAGACDDHQVYVWTRADEEWGRPKVLRGHEGSVNALAPSRDGLRLATGDDVGRLLIWDLTGPMERPVRTLIDEGPLILGLSFDADGSHVATVGEGQPPRLWSLESGRSVAFAGLKKPDEPTLAVAVSPGGGRLAVGGADETVTVWDVAAPDAPRHLNGHFDTVNALAFSPDETRLVSADSDGMVSFFDVETGEKILSRRSGEDAVEALAFCDEGETLATAGGDGSVVLWVALPTPRTADLKPRRLESGAGSVLTLAIRPDGRQVASAGPEGTIRLWDEPTGDLAMELKGHQNRVTALAYSPDGRRLASTCRDGLILLWDLDSTPRSRALGKHDGRCIALAYGRDGRSIVTGGADRKIKLWNLDTMDLAQERSVPYPVYCLALDREGTTLASSGADADHAITLWRLDSRGLLEDRKLVGHSRQVNSLSFDLVDGRLVSASHDRTARIWNLEAEATQPLEGHVSRLWGVAASHASRWVATASGDRTIRLWDSADGREVATLLSHTGRVRTVAFSPDDRFLASSGDDGSVYLWDSSHWRPDKSDGPISADRIAATNSGPAPQQPPTNPAPASTSAGTYDANSAGDVE